jgi:hypothetical protein
VRVFVDIDEQATLWGKHLYEHLHEIYSNKACYVMILISEGYVRKLWPRHEWRAVQERALKEVEREYVLPVRLDEAQVPGLSELIGWVSINEGAERIAELFLEKLRAR